MHGKLAETHTQFTIDLCTCRFTDKLQCVNFKLLANCWSIKCSISSDYTVVLSAWKKCVNQLANGVTL